MVNATGSYALDVGQAVLPFEDVVCAGFATSISYIFEKKSCGPVGDQQGELLT